jgi:hypothetical protein
LGEQDAADIVHALASPEVCGLLAVDRGWSDERYEEWLRRTLVHQLLGEDQAGVHAAGRTVRR